MTDDHVHVSDLRWDRLLGGELAADAKAEVLAAAETCPVCAERLGTLTRESDAFARRPPLAVKRPRTRAAWLVAPAVLAAAAAVVLVVRARNEPEPPGERAKGDGPQLLVMAGAPGRLAVVASGDRVRPGDHVQAGYSAERAGFGAVLGIDRTGTASVYVPAHAEAMAPLAAGSERSFPASIVLDDVLGEETLIVLWCELPHPLGPLVAELAARGDITAPAGCAHRRVTLDKRAEPE